MKLTAGVKKPISRPSYTCSLQVLQSRYMLTLRLSDYS